MRRFFAVLLAAGLAVLPGCGGTGRTVSIEGSTAMVLVAEALREGFAEREPGVAVNCSGTGSGAGVEAAVSGRCDIGLSSRALREAELARGAQAHLIALDGVAVIVHPSNPAAGLAGAELARLFTGEITNWSELGGPDAPVAAYGWTATVDRAAPGPCSARPSVPVSSFPGSLCRGFALTLPIIAFAML